MKKRLLPAIIRLFSALLWVSSSLSVFGQAHDIPKGCKTIPIPAGTTAFDAQLKNTLKYTNAEGIETGQYASDVRVTLLPPAPFNTKVTGMQITEGPAEIVDNHAVDDNNNGWLEGGENDILQSPANATCRIIFGIPSTLAPDGTIKLNVEFNGPAPAGTQMVICFSSIGKDLNGNTQHKDQLSVVPLGPAGATVGADVPPGTHLANFSLVNTTPDFMAAMLVQHPVPVEQFSLEPPYNASVLEPGGTGGFMLFFVPPLAPFDFADANVIYGIPSEPGMPPQLFTTLETFPYNCNLAVHDLVPGSCNALGTYDLTFRVKYEPVGAGFWKEYTFTNNTTKTMSDLHVTFRGTGGSLTTTVVTNPEGCPDPEIPSNGKVTNTMELDWGANCVGPGKSVKVKVCTVNGPLEPAGGYWTIDGVKDAELTEADIIAGQQGGQQGDDMDFFINGEYAGSYTPLGLGDETVTLAGLPANGVAGASLSAVWPNGFNCFSNNVGIFTAPECANTGFFEIETVRQVGFASPVLAPRTDLGELTFRYYNPLGSTDKYLNIVQLPPFSSAPVWMADNIDLETFGDTASYHFSFDLDPFGAYPFEWFERAELAVFITDDIFTEMPLPTNFVPYPVGEVVYNFGNNASQIAELTTVFPQPLPSQPQRVWEADSVRTVLRGCAMPNIDLIDSLHHGHPHVPADYANDWNACGPAATTNSFTWLRAQHAVLDSLLDRDSLLNNNANDSTARRQMLYEFSRLMDRPVDSYTRLDSFIMGKLAFVDKYRLPVHVKYQSIIWNNDIPSPDATQGHSADNQNAPTDPARPNAKISLEWLYQEMKKGEDVELLMHWVTYDSLGNPVFTGHYVTLTGIRYNHGNWRLRLKHDWDQSRPGGLRHDITGARSTNDSVPFYGRGLIELENLRDSTLGRCYITHAVSESFDSTITFVGTHQPAGMGAIACRVLGNPAREGGAPAVLEVLLPEEAELHVAVLDSRGQRLRDLNPGHQPAGLHRFNLPVEGLDSGIYWIAVQTGMGRGVAKLVIIR